MPRRSRKYGVGKEIGGAIYLHRAYEPALGRGVERAKSLIPSDFQYTIVKQNLATGAISFIDSPDFDTAPEPTVGDTWIVRADGTTRFRKQAADRYLYHHKWLMVGDDYQGFDVRESQRRSRAWVVLDGIDRSRIGRKSYWTSVVLPQLDTNPRETPAQPRQNSNPDRLSDTER